MRSQIDSYSMLICSKYVRSISDMINITLVNSKFKDNIDKFHFNPFQINQKSRKYFINLQTQWLFDINDELFSDGDISGYYLYYQLYYNDYLTMKNKYQNIKCRRIIYTDVDRLKYRNEIPFVVNKLDENCFYESNIKEIKIPNSIVEIGNNCFYNCQSLTSITMSSRLTKIGDKFLSYCNKLTIPTTIISQLNHIGSYCFNNRGINEITLTNQITYIGENAFSNNPIKTVIIPSSLSCLNSSFNKCSELTHIELPDSITCLGKYCFFECINLRTLILPNSITGFRISSFLNCSSLESIVIPSLIKELPKYCFDECKSLTRIELPSSLTSIGYNCFKGCIKLKEINIPMSVIRIGNFAFKNCSQLASITGNVDVCLKFKESFENTPFLKHFKKESRRYIF